MPLADFSFAALFGSLPPRAVLDAFALLVAERKLCLVSACPALLTPAAEALLSLLAPFRWQVRVADVPIAAF